MFDTLLLKSIVKIHVPWMQGGCQDRLAGSASMGADDPL
jgi:hypothetical protein